MFTLHLRRLASFLISGALVMSACGGSDSSPKSDTMSRQRNVALTESSLNSLLTPRFFTTSTHASLVITNDNELVIWGLFPKSYANDWQMEYEENPTPPVSQVRVAAMDETMAVAIGLDNKAYAWGPGAKFADYTTLPEGLDPSKLTSLFLNLGAVGGIDSDGKLWVWGPAASWGAAVPEAISQKKITAYTTFNGQYSMVMDEDGKVSTWGGGYPIVPRIQERFDGISARSIYSNANQAIVVTTEGEVLHVTDSPNRDLQLFEGIDVQQVVVTGMNTYVAIDTNGKLHVDDDGYNDGWKDYIDAWNDEYAGSFGENMPVLGAGVRHVAIFADGYVRNISGRDWLGYLVMPEYFHSGQYVAPIAAGPYSTYALDEDFTINTFHNSENATQLAAPEGSDFMAIAAGWTHGLAVRRNGKLVTWGDAPNNGALPEIEGRVTRIGAGFHLSAALDNYGNIFEWGEFFSPTNNIKDRPSDEQCIYYDNLKVGYNTIIATGITCEGRSRVLHVWGDNSFGQANIPEDLDTSDLTNIAASYNCMAAVVNGAIRTWGDCPDGQSDVPEGVDFQDVELGWGFAVGVTTDGVPMVWGTLPRQELSPPAGLQNISSLSIGYEHVVAVDWSGNVTSWGSNLYGESTVPAKFKPLPPVEPMPNIDEAIYRTARENAEALADTIANPIATPSVIDDVVVIVSRNGEQTETTLPVPVAVAALPEPTRTVQYDTTIVLPASQNPIVSVGSVVNTSQATKRLGLTKVSGVTFVVPKKVSSASSRVCTITSKSVTVIARGICDVKVSYTDAKKKKRSKALTLIANG
ncbi:MAG: hypothetical protein FJW98_06940 [Actinobacteria bacterium]|nr:hypothetical protein [Actinomycetota bacterium]